MRKILWNIFGIWLCGLFAAVAADSYQLADGTTISGDVVSYTDNGIIFRQGDDKYTDRMPWLKFSQESLKQLAQNPKIAPFVEPFIEPPPPAAAQPKKINVLEPTRPARPASASFFGGLFSSPVSLIALLLIYAANIFAGYEVAIFRNKPPGMVVGVSAVLPVLGPIIFLSMISPPVEAVPVEEIAAAPPPEPQHFAVPQHTPPTAAARAAAPAPHHFSVPQHAPSSPEKQEDIQIVASGFSGEPPPPPKEEVEIFQRGQYMFNRRFFETKFAGFFSIVRSETDRQKILMVKIPATMLTVERISRIGANDVHFEVVQGGERHEMLVAFADIQQIQLKTKA